MRTDCDTPRADVAFDEARLMDDDWDALLHVCNAARTLERELAASDRLRRDQVSSLMATERALEAEKRELGEYAELLATKGRQLLEVLDHIPLLDRINTDEYAHLNGAERAFRAALAKNPNPAASAGDASASAALSEPSGPVGLGPSCIFRAGCKTPTYCGSVQRCTGNDEPTKGMDRAESARLRNLWTRMRGLLQEAQVHAQGRPMSMRACTPERLAERIEDVLRETIGIAPGDEPPSQDLDQARDAARWRAFSTRVYAEPQGNCGMVFFRFPVLFGGPEILKGSVVQHFAAAVDEKWLSRPNPNASHEIGDSK